MSGKNHDLSAWNFICQADVAILSAWNFLRQVEITILSVWYFICQVDITFYACGILYVA